MTLVDLARQLGVSPATVSTALNRPQEVAEETRSRVYAAVEAAGYQPNAAARQLRVGSSDVYLLIVSDLSNPIFAEVAKGARQAAREHGRELLIADADESEVVQDQLINLALKQQFAGIALSPVAGPPRRLPEVRKRGMPFVLVGTPPDDLGGYPSASGDDRLGGRLAVRHLAESGYPEVLFVAGPPAQTRIRLDGARQEARALGIGWREESVSALTMNQGVDFVRNHSRRWHDVGIFAGNDLLAIGILHGLLERGVVVPDDVGVVGYDDNAFAENSLVPLTSVRHDTQLQGRVVAQLLRSDDPTTVPQLLEPVLLRRASTDRKVI